MFRICICNVYVIIVYVYVICTSINIHSRPLKKGSVVTFTETYTQTLNENVNKLVPLKGFRYTCVTWIKCFFFQMYYKYHLYIVLNKLVRRRLCVKTLKFITLYVCIVTSRGPCIRIHDCLTFSFSLQRC